jgi:hypothetical protein
MKGLGILLIVFGVLAAASAAATYQLGEAKGLPAGRRLFNAAGGLLCCLSLVIPGSIFLASRDSKRSGTHRSRGRRRTSPSRKPGPNSATPVAPKPARERPGERRERLSLAELAGDSRYAEAVRIVYRAVTALPRSPSGVPDPEHLLVAFDSGVSHLVAAGVAAEEARTNLGRLIEADAARGTPGASGAEAEPGTAPGPVT